MGGFKHWFQGMVMIGLFFGAVGVPCFFIALWGSKMINDLGNFPTKSVQIQAAASWKILLVEALSFLLLVGLFAFLYSLNQ